MKKLLLTALAATTIGVSAQAQVSLGNIAPNFTVTDINGTSHTLYNYLDSGYMVIIDISAAWCGPCWAVHQSHVFNDLTDHYGVNGSISPKKIKVLWFDGESQNTTAQLHGPQGGSGALYTQGDWVTGTKYPIIDDDGQNANYLYGGFPSFTVITRDRIVVDQTSGYTGPMLAEGYWTALLNAGPQTGASTGIDAKLVNKEQKVGAFACSNTPTIRFQNYSKTNNITSATLKVLVGSTAVSTQSWTGNLAPYALQDVVMPGFSQAGPYKFEVTVTSDAEASNNSVTVATLPPIITPAQTTVIPSSQDFQGLTAMPAKYALGTSAKDQFILSSSLSSGGNPINVIGSNNQATNCIGVMYQNNANASEEIMLGNYNTSAASAPAFKFDVAYKQRSAASNDKLEVLISADCGATWQNVYSKSGSSLTTVSGFVPNTSFFLPGAGTDWRTETVYSLPKINSLFVKMIATTSATNPSYGWIDNFNFVASATNVANVISDNALQLYPNPTRDAATLEFTSIKSSNVGIQVVDMTGRIVLVVANDNIAAGTHKFNINTASLPSGIYNVKIQTEEGSLTERLTVVK